VEAPGRKLSSQAVNVLPRLQELISIGDIGAGERTSELIPKTNTREDDT